MTTVWPVRGLWALTSWLSAYRNHIWWFYQVLCAEANETVWVAALSEDVNDGTAVLTRWKLSALLDCASGAREIEIRTVAHRCNDTHIAARFEIVAPRGSHVKENGKKIMKNRKLKI